MTRFAFAGDRAIAVKILQFLVDGGAYPELLMVPSPDKASHADELKALSGLSADKILVGSNFREAGGLELLRACDVDYVFGIHFPYIVPAEVLAVPKVGVLNLHPAYLPYNRGWHTPSWAILEGSPIGATLHFMDDGLDTGDIVAQRELAVTIEDTADTLYQRLLALEVELFKESWPLLLTNMPPRSKQESGGSAHKRADLFDDSVQRIDLNAEQTAESFFRQLRGLTTNRPGEAAWFEFGGRRYRVQISITPEPTEET